MSFRKLFSGLITGPYAKKHSAGLQDIAGAANAAMNYSGSEEGGLMNYVGATDAALGQLSPGYKQLGNFAQGGSQMLEGNFNQGFNTMSGGMLDRLSNVYNGSSQILNGNFNQGMQTLAGGRSGGLGGSAGSLFGAPQNTGATGGLLDMGLGTEATGAGVGAAGSAASTGTSAAAAEEGGLVNWILSLL